MNDIQIRYILSVAETRSFTRAAELNHVQQPAISAQIRQAEEALGFTIFYRKKTGVEPTPAGHELIEWLTETQHTFLGMKERALALESRNNRKVHIGVLGYYHYFPLCEAIDLTMQQNDGASIYLEVMGPNELIANAADNKYDALFCEQDLFTRLPTFHFYELGHIEWVIIYSRLSRFASMKNLSLSDFSNALFIGPGNIKENQTGLLPFHNVLFKNAGVLYPKVVPAPNVESTILQIQSNLGVGFCTKEYAEGLQSTLCYLETGIQSSVGLAVPSKITNPIVGQLVSNLKYCATRHAVTSRLR